MLQMGEIQMRINDGYRDLVDQDCCRVFWDKREVECISDFNKYPVYGLNSRNRQKKCKYCFSN